jgi:hypothetical protein
MIMGENCFLLEQTGFPGASFQLALREPVANASGSQAKKF